MPLNLYNYYTGPHLVGDSYQHEIPAIAYQRLRSQVKSGSQNHNDEEQQTLRRYKPIIMKDPDLAAEFATMYLRDSLYGGEEKFIADNARDLSNLITYMRKFGVNDPMRDRIMRGDIVNRMKYAGQVIKSPLDPKFNKEILTAPSVDLALYAAEFEEEKYHNVSPASFWKQVRQRILEDDTATAVYLGITKRRWAEGEELLMQTYARDPAIGPLFKWAIKGMAENAKNPSDLDDLVMRMRQIDNKREHQN